MSGSRGGRLRSFSSLALMLGAGLIGVPQLQSQTWDATSATRDIATRYIETTFAQRYDDLLQLYAADVSFIDPTADIFGPGSRALAGVHGSLNLVELQKSWGIVSSDFRIDTHMFVGEYGIFAGELNVTFQGGGGQPAEFDVPFVTVIGVSDGQVVSRTDYGDYRSMVGADVSRATARTDSVARAYLAAYLEQRRDEMAAISSSEITFQDPTARVFNPRVGRPIHGLDAVQANFDEAFGSIEQFEMTVDRSIVANHHAMFLGQIRFSMRGQDLGSSADLVHFEHPAIIVITVEDGVVTHHRDYVDYSYFPGQLEEQR